VEKREALPDREDLRWHLVGHLQRNKARRGLESCRSIHSLDSERLARKLEEELMRVDPSGAPPERLSLYVEVNISGEASKAGLRPEEAPAFLEMLRQFPGVSGRVIGLMTIAPESPDPEAARPPFRRLRERRDALVAQGLLPPPEGTRPGGAGLSMGMSGDFEVAVEEGATVVRVGTRLFQGLPAEARRGP